MVFRPEGIINGAADMGNRHIKLLVIVVWKETSMLDLKGHMGFVVSEDDTSIEAKYLLTYCSVNTIRVVRARKHKLLPANYVPSGNVKWTQLFMPYCPVPDYYPDWLSSILYRRVWKHDRWIRGSRLFVKPADRYKRFTGFVTHGTWAKKKKGPLWWSEVVEFVNEWRYYITNGVVVYAYWYWGPINTVVEPPAPPFPVDIPADFCGAVDLGTFPDGRLALIESQHPFACGWYGGYNDIEIYLQWLVDGWQYMKSEWKREAI